jgi:hypothetical protein
LGFTEPYQEEPVRADTMDHNQKTTLGCGTLILIALIVVIFGNISGYDSAEEIKKLSKEVRTLQSTVSDQTQAIKRLEKSVSQALERNKNETEKK